MLHTHVVCFAVADCAILCDITATGADLHRNVSVLKDLLARLAVGASGIAVGPADAGLRVLRVAQVEVDCRPASKAPVVPTPVNIDVNLGVFARRFSAVTDRFFRVLVPVS